jgi:hypothetical protein
MSADRSTSDPHARGGFEPDRPNLRAYYLTLAGTAFVTLLAVWLVAVVLPHFASALRRPIVLPVPRAQRLPEPHLQVDPPADLQALRSAERARLSSYGFVDRDHAVVHIPIDVAKRRLLERGLPMRPEAR